MFCIKTFVIAISYRMYSVKNNNFLVNIVLRYSALTAWFLTISIVDSVSTK